MRTDPPAAPDSAVALAAHIAQTRFDHLPVPVVRAVKEAILDTLGCVLAGTGCADVATIRDMARRWNERPACTVIGSGGMKVSPATAVLVNGAAIHQYDFDDTHDRATCHPSSSSVVPALAIAESAGGASGPDLIRAVALGNEVTARVSLAIRGKVHDYPWFRAPVVGLFGATTSAVCMFGASADQCVEAFGLALPMVGGTFASLHHHGSSVRSIRDGMAYRNGLLAAELAMNGIRGDREVFDGPFGFYRAYFGGHYDRELLVGELGVRHEAQRISLKPWPSIRHLHATLTAVLELMDRHALGFDDIGAVDVAVGTINLDRCRPLPPRGTGHDHIDLLHNLHFAVANAILHRGLPLEVYREPARAQHVIEVAMPKVHSRHDPGQDGPWSFEPGRVSITTVSGLVHHGVCRVALGHPDHPMTDAQRHEKFLSCARHAAKPPPRPEQVIALVERLEELDSVTPLLEALA